MARYADWLKVRVHAYDENGPLPENVEEGWALAFDVGERFDREQLVEDIEEVLRPEPFVFEDRWSHFSWGAEGAALEIIIGVASGTGVLVVERIAELLARRFRKRESAEPTTAEEAVSKARELLAESREVALDSVKVESVERLPSGFRIALSVHSGQRFAVEVDERGSLYRLKREAASDS